MKKFLIIMLSVLCCLSLAACGGTSNGGDDSAKKTESVKLIDKEITVYVGGTYKFEPTGADSFTYASADESVAKVSESGVLTGISDGVTFVDVSAGSAKVTCKVNVIKAENYIRFNADNQYAVVGGDAVIKAQVILNGKEANDGVEFTCDKTDGITIEKSGENEITASVTEKGKYVITATAAGLSAQCTVKAVGANATILSAPELSVENCELLKWQQVSGASGYAVSVNGGGETVVSEPSYNVKSVTDELKFGDKAVFSVRAVVGADDFDHIDGIPVVTDFSHDYKETVITAHTCQTAGKSDFACSVCGKKYTEEARIDDHNYVDGACANVISVVDGKNVLCGFGQTAKISYKYDEINDCYFVEGPDGGYDSEDLYIRAKYNDGNPDHGEKQVKYIAINAFKDNNVIKRVFLPASMTEFVDKDPNFVYDFDTSRSLNDVDGMNGKSSPLKGYVFDNCTNLEYVSMPGIHTLPAVAQSVYSHWNFRDCYNLKTVIVPDGFENRGASFMRWVYTPSSAVNSADVYVLYSGVDESGNHVKGEVNRICDPESYPVGSDVGLGNNTLLTGNVYVYDDNATKDACFKWKYDSDGSVVSGGVHSYNGKNVCRKCGAKNDFGVSYAYNSSADSYYVAYYGGNDEIVEILSEYSDGVHGYKPVTYVGKQAFMGNGSIKKVILPASVTDLGGAVFMNCANLEYVDARGVSNIQYGSGGRPDGANESNNNFRNCSKLTTVIIGDGFSSNVGQFNNGDGYVTIDLYVYGTATITTNGSDDALTGNIYYLGDGVKCATWNFDENGEIVKGAASHNFVDGECVICGEKDAKGINYVYSSATDSYYVAGYTGNSEVVTVLGTWNDGEHGEKAVTYVGKQAFMGNGSIKKVILPASVTDLGGAVFMNCERLEYVDARGVSNIQYANAGRPDGANESNNNFRNCSNLTTVIIGDGFTSNVGQFNNGDGHITIDLYVYGTTPITTNGSDDALTGNIYYLGDGVKCETWKFSDSGEIVKGAASHNIVNGVCTNCGERNSMGVTYAYSSATGSYYVAGYTGSYETVTVFSVWDDGTNGKKSVTYVAKEAFANKTMKKVILPASVTDLGGGVFTNCYALEYVDMRGVTYISYWNERLNGDKESNNNFLNCDKLKVVIVGDGYHADAQQFVTQTPSFTPVLEMFVYGSTTVSLADNDKLVKTVYYSGDGVKCATWKFDDNGEIIKGAASHNLVNGVCTNCGERNAMGVTYAYSSATGSYYVAGYTGSYETVTVFSVWDDGTNGKKLVTYVAKEAFANKTMKKVILPASVTDLGGAVFMNCANLEYVDARGVSNIQYANSSRPDGANESNNNFRNCSNLTTVIIGDGFSSNVGQFNNGDGHVTIDLYVYGTTTITTNGSDDALTGNIYYYSEAESTGCWHFVDGVPALW